MIPWQVLIARAPDFAAAGSRLFVPGADGISIGFLATVTAAGKPRLAPVCPIFFDQGIYLSVGAPTPKRADLSERGDYVLHTFLGANDEEFQIAGRGRIVDDQAVGQLHSRAGGHRTGALGVLGERGPAGQPAHQTSMVGEGLWLVSRRVKWGLTPFSSGQELSFRPETSSGHKPIRKGLYQRRSHRRRWWLLS